MSDPLALPPDEIRRAGLAALDRIASYYETLRERPILVPTTSESLRALLDEPLPQDGVPFETLLGDLDAKI